MSRPRTICSRQEANARARSYQMGPRMASAWSRLRVSRGSPAGLVSGSQDRARAGTRTIAADPLAPHHLEPGCGHGRLDRWLVHARRRVLQPLDQQAPVARASWSAVNTAYSTIPPPDRSTRAHSRSTCRAVADTTGHHDTTPGHRCHRRPAGLQVARDQCDLGAKAGRGGLGRRWAARPGPDRRQAPGSRSAGPGRGVGGVPAAGIQDQLSGGKAQPARRLQQQVRRPGAKASLKQLITLGRPALAGVELGQGSAGCWVGHGSDAGRAGPPRRGVPARTAGPPPGPEPPTFPRRLTARYATEVQSRHWLEAGARWAGR